MSWERHGWAGGAVHENYLVEARMPKCSLRALCINIEQGGIKEGEQMFPTKNDMTGDSL